MPYIQVHVDCDDFDTDDLVEEICRRIKREGRSELSTDQKIRVKDTYEDLGKALALSPQKGISIKTLDDKMKFEHIATVFEKYTSTQIENLLP